MERKTLDASYVYADDFYLEIIDPNNTEELNFYIFENSEVLMNNVLSVSTTH